MILFIKIKLKFFRHVIFSVMKSRQQFIKEITLLIVILAAILASTNVYAQLSAKERKANLYYNRFSYIKAIQRYESINNISVSGLRNLALSYKRTNQLDKSKQTFEQFINGPEATLEDYFNYASILRMLANYDESINWLDKFAKARPNDNRSKSYARIAKDKSTLTQDEGRFTITYLPINTDAQDFGACFYNNQMVFASTRIGVNVVKRLYNWNEKPFLNMYVSDRIDDMMLGEPRQFRKQLNKKLHEGPASFNALGTIMAFTRNNYKEKSTDNAVKFGIFFSEKNNKGEWGKEVPFKVNNKEYNVGHPSLTSDGNMMYFSSDMPGGFGGSDIYIITRNTDGSWGNAINAGPEVNTEADEMFPFYHEDLRILFFSSNGHIGLGGLDIYFSPDMGDGKFNKVYNAGVPINTQFDDFSFVLDDIMKYGYFTSNREGGKGDDDIYAFELIKQFPTGKKINGIAKDLEGNILANTKVDLYNDKGDLVQSYITKVNGQYLFYIEPGFEYLLIGSKEKYFEGFIKADTKTQDDEVLANLILEKNQGIALFTQVKDGKTGNPLEGVRMVITDNKTNTEFNNLITPKTGHSLKVIENITIGDTVSYTIKISKEGYFDKSYTITQPINKPRTIIAYLTMEKRVINVAELLEIDVVRFDLNKYNIRPDAALQLDKLIKLMNEYPDMVIQLRSYTDCRGTVKYNKYLSMRRAKSSAAYVKRHITNPKRLTYIGMGESNILNGCECESPIQSNCSEEEHQKNRRTEMIVISTDGVKADLKKKINTLK